MNVAEKNEILILYLLSDFTRFVKTRESNKYETLLPVMRNYIKEMLGNNSLKTFDRQIKNLSKKKCD